MNKVLLTGRLTKDPTFVSYDSGASGFATFSLAVSRPNTKNDITDFFNCVIWKEKANYVMKYVKKGDLVAITGVLQTRSYLDKKTNKQTVTIEIYVEQLDLMTKRDIKEETFDVNADEVYQPAW